MRRLIFWAAAALAIVLGGGPTWAADVPMVFKAPKPLDPPDPPWTGLYGGIHAGYGWGDKRFIDNFPTPDGELDASPSVQGAFGGFQGGFNRQFGRFVLGVEGDFSWSGVKSTFSCFPFGDQVCTAHPEWFASLAGRLGYTWGPNLFYLKGGAALTEDHFTDVATCAGSQPRSRAGITAACGDGFVANDLRPGWLVGIGVERFFAPNWSAKVEYQYLDFGSKSVAFTDGANGFFTEEIHQKINLFMLGLNYHFGPTPSGPYASAAPADDEAPKRVLVFSSFDVGKDSYGGTLGTMIAPYKDLDTSGLRFYMMGEAGTYKYPAGGNSIRGVYEGGDALAGYAFEGDNYSINLLAGLNAVNHTLSDVDPENAVQGSRLGAKVRADAWINPTPKTLTYGEAEYSTAFSTYYTKLKLGYDLTGKEIFIGPEVAALGDERYNQWRVGGHVTQMKLGPVQIDVSAGYANDSVVGSGAYGTVEVSTNF
jgi:opacity protein-like surface antigen